MPANGKARLAPLPYEAVRLEIDQVWSTSAGDVDLRFKKKLGRELVYGGFRTQHAGVSPSVKCWLFDNTDTPQRDDFGAHICVCGVRVRVRFGCVGFLDAYD